VIGGSEIGDRSALTSWGRITVRGRAFVLEFRNER
jgi:hypothetical protein